jgi:hypothetical protein
MTMELARPDKQGARTITRLLFVKSGASFAISPRDTGTLFGHDC